MQAAKTFTPEQFQAKIVDNGLSWSHARLLAGVFEAKKRQRLIDKVLADKLNATELARLLVAEQPSKPRSPGRSPAKPRGLPQGLDRLGKLSKSFQNTMSVLFGEEFDLPSEIAVAAPDTLTPKIRAAVAECADQLAAIEQTAHDASTRLKKGLERIDACIAAQAEQEKAAQAEQNEAQDHRNGRRMPARACQGISMIRPPGLHYGAVSGHSSAVLIIYRNEQLELVPPCPSLAAQLSTSARTAVPDDVHGYRLTTRGELLLGPAETRLNAGLTLAVCRLLHHAGYVHAELGRSSPWPAKLPAPDEAGVRWRGPCDAEMLAFVGAWDRGLIRYDGRGAVEAAWIIAQIALAYPQAKIAVMAASTSAGFRLRSQISRWVCGVVMMKDDSGEERRVGRVVVGTPSGLGHNSVELNKRDILIVPRAWEVLQNHFQLALGGVDPNFRLFGLVPSGYKFSPYEFDLTVAAFGFQEVFIPRHGYVQRPVRTVWLPVDGGPQVAHDASVLTLKRLGVWQHPVRSRRVAQVARAISHQDLSWLRKCLPDAATFVELFSPCRGVVLVESVEHALALAARLPEWPVIVGDDVIEYGLDPNQRQLLAQRRALPNATGPVIATVDGMSRPGALDLNTVDVLVWAGAGARLAAAARRPVDLPPRAGPRPTVGRFCRPARPPAAPLEPAPAEGLPGGRLDCARRQPRAGPHRPVPGPPGRKEGADERLIAVSPPLPVPPSTAARSAYPPLASTPASRASSAREVYRPQPGQQPDFARIVDHENLLLAFDKLRAEGGAAPGIDGLTYDDFSRAEIAAVLRMVAPQVGQLPLPAPPHPPGPHPQGQRRDPGSSG